MADIGLLLRLGRASPLAAMVEAGRCLAAKGRKACSWWADRDDTGRIDAGLYARSAVENRGRVCKEDSRVPGEYAKGRCAVKGEEAVLKRVLQYCKKDALICLGQILGIIQNESDKVSVD